MEYEIEDSYEEDLSPTVPADTLDDRYAGVRALWLKVIIRAIFDWVTYRDSTKLMQKKLAESAYTWLYEPNEMFNSFENICGYLDISAETIRKHARCMSKADVAKIEHLERIGSGGPLSPLAVLLSDQVEDEVV